MELSARCCLTHTLIKKEKRKTAESPAAPRLPSQGTGATAGGEATAPTPQEAPRDCLRCVSKASELGGPLLFDPHINNEKEAENSSESCSPTPAFSGHWCSSFYISRRLAAKLRPQHLKRLRETASAAFSKASELGDPLLFDPHINQEKEAENSSVSCSPASASLWCRCSSYYIGRWLVATLRYKYLKRLSWIVSTAFSKALELEDPLLFDPHIDHDKEAENSCVSCSPASAFSWRWHSSFYICHSDGS